MITDVEFINSLGGVSNVITMNMKMTPYGIHYVEDKINNILKNVASWGWDQLKDIAARTLTEMSKN